MGKDVEDLGMGRGKHAVVGGIFQGCGSEGSSICFGYMGDYPTHGPGPGGGSIKRWPEGTREVIHGGFRAEVGSTPPLEEAMREADLEGCTVYFSASNYGPL